MHGGIELVADDGRMADRDRVNGSDNEIAGRAKREAGERTGDTNAQIEGFAQEVMGKAQKTWGGVKDAVRAACEEVRHEEVRQEQQENDPAGN
jgi:uncharacterized protein YjbJ (UPF0337 family)